MEALDLFFNGLSAIATVLSSLALIYTKKTRKLLLKNNSNQTKVIGKGNSTLQANKDINISISENTNKTNNEVLRGDCVDGDGVYYTYEIRFNGSKYATFVNGNEGTIKDSGYVFDTQDQAKQHIEAIGYVLVK